MSPPPMDRREYPDAYTDLPDLSTTAEDRITIGDVRCGALILSSPGLDPVESDGHVCWRSSGSFSVSVTTVNGSAQVTADLVDEMWSQQ